VFHQQVAPCVSYALFTHMIRSSLNRRTICVPFAYHMRTICVPFAYHLCTICVPYAYKMHTICVQDAYHIFLIKLMRIIYCQDYTAIPKQLQQLKDRAKQYSTTVDMPKFKREFQTERAIYNKIVQLFGRRQDNERKKSEIEICEKKLFSKVYSQDRKLAKTLRRRLEAKPPLTYDTC
jgi:hypothetical protein